jgi:TonB family protein
MHAIVAAALALAALLPGPEQEWLGAAKEQYASAAYEEALSTLTRVDGSATPELKRQVEQYRVFCLFALGRNAEAEAAAESLIRTHPAFQPDPTDASPRILDMFAAVRQRLLPELIRNEYRAARSARDAKNLTEAEANLVEARQLLDEAERLGVANDTHGDLGLLVDGFLELIRADTASSPSGAAAPVEPPRSPAAHSPIAARTYTTSDRDVSPPVAIRQTIPEPPPQLLAIMRALQQKTGRIDVLVDEAGTVVNAVVRESVNSSYDSVLLRAAREWRYQPAMKDGVPVRYLKPVAVTVTSRN